MKLYCVMTEIHCDLIIKLSQLFAKIRGLRLQNKNITVEWLMLKKVQKLIGHY